MCKKAVFLASSILVLLVVANTGLAETVTWSGASGTDWCTAGNWSPSQLPGADDDAYIYSAKPVPTVLGSACPGDIDANVGNMRGPSIGGGTQAMDITDATFLVQNTWLIGDSASTNATVNISGSSVVEVFGTGIAWRGSDFGTFNLNLLSTGSGDPNLWVNGTLASADDDSGYFVFTIDNGQLTTVGQLSWGDDGGGEFYVSGERTELHLGSMRFGLRAPGTTMLFNMTGGLIDIDGGWSMGGENDNLYTDPNAIQINFDAGKIICNDFTMHSNGTWEDGVPFKMDFEQNAVLEIKQDRKAEMENWIALKYITGKNGTEAPTAANIGGHTFVGFDIYQKEASDPYPPSPTGGICPTGITLTWKAGDKADQHKIFFGTSFEDVNSMTDPCATKSRGDETYDTGTLSYGMTYYWRIDEVNNTEPNTWRGPVWNFSTPSGKAGNPTPGDGQRGVVPGTVVLSWDIPCYLVGQTLSYGTTFPQDGTWTTVALGPSETSYSIATETFKNYYWRVDIDDGSGTITGNDWDFRTGYGGLLMYHKFDGTIGNDLPSPVTDNSGNFIQFTKYVDGGYVKYAASGHGGVLASTASANFEPSAGLYRDDPCGASEDTPDLLRLDGSEYTVELWCKAESFTDADEIWLLYKHGSWGLKLDSLPGCSASGCDNSYRWYSSGGQSAISDDGTVAELGEWIHIAVVCDEFGDLGGIYLNGVKQDFGDGGGEGNPNPADNNSPIWIGAARLPDGSFRGGFFDGQIDEVRVHDIALGPCAFLIDGSDPEMPICPTPTDGEQDVDPCGVILSWTGGESATTHKVYVSSELPDVENMDPSVKKYDGPNTTVLLAEDLDNGTTYYWRVVENTGYEGPVWSFTTTYVLVDPSLRLWYEFDETWGDTAHDHSGRGYHADGADDQWDPEGKWDGCLVFDDDITLEPSSEVFATVSSGVTVAVWLNSEVGWGGSQAVFDTGWETSPYRLQAVIPDGAGNVTWRAGNDTNDLMIWREASPRAWAGDWHHFAFVKDQTTDTMSIYFDGLLADTKSGTIDSLSNIYMSRPFKIGAYAWHLDGDYQGKMDDFRVYDRVLTDTEVSAIYRGGDLDIAWGPSPYDGQPDALPDANLTWFPGDHAAQHKVFFGESWDDVNSMTDPCATKSLGDETYDPGTLELDTYYFWRIDEVNGPNTWRGPIWRFKVADFIILDDFESYDKGTNLIWYTWYCKQAMPYGQRSGAYLELSTSIVHGGDQAMKYNYETDETQYWDQDYAYADACLPLDEIGGFQDWTSVDVRLVTIFFYGQADNDTNDTEQMYMAVHNATANYAEVRYGDHPGEALTDLKVEEWQRWDVPFIWFTDSNAEVSANVDFSAISSVYLGFGDKRNPVPAGNGVVYFDDLRLTMPICKPEQGPEGDLNGDCFVGVADIGVIGDQWLRGDVNLNPVVNPGTGNLVGHWELDGDATDSSAYANHGTAEGAYDWVDGHIGSGAIELSGGKVLVPDAPELRPAAQISAAAWINYSQETGYSARVVVKGIDEGNNENFAVQLDGSTASFFVRDVNRGLHDVDADDEIAQGEWAHVAGTYDGNTVKCYVNGQLSGSEGVGLITLLQDTNDLAIGNRTDADDRAFRGTIDDVRVYNRALTREEVAYLASEGDGILEMVSEANLYSGETPETINFRDFARLFDYWGAEQLWPPQPIP